ncbi:MAG TPA: hypothetical protein VI893_06220, partial [Thermoplasmata archaeon]|nr:hypothetical protein [Thermoplasmata archaeon]
PAPAEPPGPDDHLEVDGHIGDWTGVPRAEPPVSPTIDGTGIDVTGIRWTLAAARTYVLVETARVAFAGEEFPVAPYILPSQAPGPPATVSCPGDYDCDGTPDADDADDDADGIPDPFDLDPLDPKVGDRWPESGAVSASRRRGEDRLYLFFDLDGDGVGFKAPWLPFPADVATEVTGRAHQVMSKASFRWHLDGFVSLSGESVALAPSALEIGGEWTSRSVFVLLTDWTAVLADSTAGELLISGDLGFRFLSNPCTIDLATDATPEDPAWGSATEGWFNDTPGDGGSPRFDLTAGKVCNNATWIFFLVDIVGVPIEPTTHTYSVYIDAGQDGSEDWALLWTADFFPVSEPVLYQNVSGVWIASPIVPGDHADACTTCGFVELGIELLSLGNPANLSYYLATESDTSPGGSFNDRGPDGSGYGGDYTIPEVGTGAAAVVLGFSLLMLAIGARGRTSPPRIRRPTVT